MASEVTTSRILCENCQKSFDKMKRCTRCKFVYYCSQDCQIKDWSKHKDNCESFKNFEANETSHHKIDFSDEKEDISTVSKGAGITSNTNDNKGFLYTRINFEKAVQDLKSKPTVESVSSTKNESSNENRKFYYHNNESYFDVPVLKNDQPFTNVTVKCDKMKRKFEMNLNWTGEEVYKYISCELEIPLEKLKIINKGKVVTQETIKDCVAAPKPVFQILGEKSQNEEGLDKHDIDVMMKQLGIERNCAVKTLRQKGDLIDAIIEAGNKK